MEYTDFSSAQSHADKNKRCNFSACPISFLLFLTLHHVLPLSAFYRKQIRYIRADFPPKKCRIQRTAYLSKPYYTIMLYCILFSRHYTLTYVGWNIPRARIARQYKCTVVEREAYGCYFLEMMTVLMRQSCKIRRTIYVFVFWPRALVLHHQIWANVK